MYRYDTIDKEMLADRVAEFREQCERRLAGELTEDQFKRIRLMNGLYLQLHAYMLRIAIPYGALTSRQLRKLGYIARTYDKGYGHFTTRTNIQMHWIKLRDAPDILEHLAEVGMHAIQTSGNDIRNITADPHAGANAEEVGRSARLGRGDPAVVDLPPRVLVPAAQIQDRHHRLAEGPGGDQGLRHRPAHPSQRRRRAGLRGAGGRRAGAHALPGPDDPRAPAGAPACSRTCRRSCGSTTATAGATTSGRRASRCWSPAWAPRSSPARSRPSGRRATRPPVDLPDEELARIRAAFAPARLRDPAGDVGLVRGGQEGRPGLRPLLPRTTSSRTRSPATPSSTSR